MINKAAYYINHFNMIPHPEGGYYTSMFRSNETIEKHALPTRYFGKRHLYSSIYFLITNDNPSTFHRLQTDEIWHLYDGEVEIHTINSEGVLNSTMLTNKSHKACFQALVPKQHWLAAETNHFALIGCTLAPGFEFEDFEIKKRDELLSLFPNHKTIIEKLATP